MKHRLVAPGMKAKGLMVQANGAHSLNLLALLLFSWFLQVSLC